MAAPASTLKSRALAVVRDRGIARARDFAAVGVPRAYLRRMQDEGILAQRGRGLYQLAEAELSAAHSLAEAARAVPHGVVCLLSALQFHELTTQTPREVWMLIGGKKWAPKRPPVALRIIRASGEALSAGIAHHAIERVPVPITVPAKTIADCFKYRSKVGLDVAIEALRDGLRKRRATVDDIWRFAAIDRVQNVMRPYLEATL
jgi:predicted transcriptional regulator of viral defense system